MNRFRVAVFGFFALAALVVGSARPPGGTGGSRESALRHRSVELCRLQADPSNKFTRVPAPPDLVDRMFGATAAVITVTYNGFTPAAQAAFQYAVNIWQAQLTAAVPVRVNATFTTLSGSTLGSAGATLVFRDFTGAPVPGTWYAKALADNLSGVDLDPTRIDIEASFNSNFTWYYGTDGLTPGGQYDFVSVVLHELAHGLGFFGSARVSGGVGQWGRGVFPDIYPDIYDRFVENASGQALLNTTLFPNPSAALAAQLQSNALYWNGPIALLKAGQRPRIYAPDLWRAGSSYSHVDEGTYPPGDPNSLMTYAIGAAEAIHDPGPVVRGMFADEGWTVAGSPCSGVTVSANHAFPLPAGAPVTWSAVAMGCDSPQYQFWLYSASSGSWTELRTWNSNGMVSWTPTQAGTYILQVWARNAGSTSAFEAWASTGSFSVVAAPCASVSLTSNVSFPVPVGTTVSWTAQATGCTSPQFVFWLYSASTGTWTELRSWGSANTATWTPTRPDTYILQAWARNVGSTAAFEAWASTGYFMVTATAACSAVSLNSNVSFPAPIGTGVVWSAQASGCSLPQYQFWLYTVSTGTWSDLRSWGSNNSATWIPMQPGTYLVQVWSRNAGSAAAFEAWASSGYVVVSPSSP